MSNPEDDLRFCPAWSATKKKGHQNKQASQECHGSHQRISKEEAEEESEIILQDLP